MLCVEVRAKPFIRPASPHSAGARSPASFDPPCQPNRRCRCTRVARPPSAKCLQLPTLVAPAPNRPADAHVLEELARHLNVTLRLHQQQRVGFFQLALRFCARHLRPQLQPAIALRLVKKGLIESGLRVGCAEQEELAPRPPQLRRLRAIAPAIRPRHSDFCRDTARRRERSACVCVAESSRACGTSSGSKPL